MPTPYAIHVRKGHELVDMAQELIQDDKMHLVDLRKSTLIYFLVGGLTGKAADEFGRVEKKSNTDALAYRDMLGLARIQDTEEDAFFVWASVASFAAGSPCDLDDTIFLVKVNKRWWEALALDKTQGVKIQRQKLHALLCSIVPSESGGTIGKPDLKFHTEQLLAFGPELDDLKQINKLLERYDGGGQEQLPLDEEAPAGEGGAPQVLGLPSMLLGLPAYPPVGRDLPLLEATPLVIAAKEEDIIDGEILAVDGEPASIDAAAIALAEREIELAKEAEREADLVPRKRYDAAVDAAWRKARNEILGRFNRLESVTLEEIEALTKINTNAHDYPRPEKYLLDKFELQESGTRGDQPQWGKICRFTVNICGVEHRVDYVPGGPFSDSVSFYSDKETGISETGYRSCYVLVARRHAWGSPFEWAREQGQKMYAERFKPKRSRKAVAPAPTAEVDENPTNVTELVHSSESPSQNDPLEVDENIPASGEGSPEPFKGPTWSATRKAFIDAVIAAGMASYVSKDNMPSFVESGRLARTILYGHDAGPASGSVLYGDELFTAALQDLPLWLKHMEQGGLPTLLRGKAKRDADKALWLGSLAPKGQKPSESASPSSTSSLPLDIEPARSTLEQANDFAALLVGGGTSGTGGPASMPSAAHGLRGGGA